MADNETRVAKALETIARSQQVMAASAKKMSEIAAKLQHPAFQGRQVSEVAILEDEISTTFTFEHPEIHGRTMIYDQEDGLVRIEILIDLDNGAERFVRLVRDIGIKELVIEAVEPE